MKVAIISDIHGHLIPLEAVLADIQRESPDQIVCLGDVAATGPQPHAVIERLQALACPVVMGNTDAFLLDPRPYAGDNEISRRFWEIEVWGVEQLSPDDLAFIDTFQPTVTVNMGDDAILLCFHGSPRSYDDIIRTTTAEADIAHLFAGYNAPVMAGGHTHEVMLRRYQSSLIINPGSVGLPYEFLPSGEAYNPAWAEYALVTDEDGEVSVTFRRVPVDAGRLIQSIRDSGMPHAAWFVKDRKSD